MLETHLSLAVGQQGAEAERSVVCSYVTTPTSIGGGGLSFCHPLEAHLPRAVRQHDSEPQPEKVCIFGVVPAYRIKSIPKGRQAGGFVA